ncbi:MAG: homoserine kinase [Candidatus Bathyarchaeia archaeon]
MKHTSSPGLAPVTERDEARHRKSKANANGSFVLAHVEAKAPATSANLGAGFDVFGVALDALFDKVAVDVVKGDNKIQLFVKGKNSELVSTNPDENTAGLAAKALLKASSKSYGLIISIEKGIRPGSGLGSSAASAAASALAVNEALQLGFTRKELVKFAALGEIAAAGVPHYDNVSAALMGFFTAVVSHEPFEVIQLPMPENIKFVVVTPEIVLETSKARSVLPKQVALSDAVHNIARASAFVAGVLTSNLTLMGMGMKDLLAEPYRASLIPGLAEVKRNAIAAGAAGVAISGSGPSVLALVDASKNVEAKVLKAMKEGFEGYGIQCEAIIAKPGPGATVVRSEEK